MTTTAFARLTTVELTLRRDNLLTVARVTTDAEHRMQLFTSADAYTAEIDRRWRAHLVNA